MTQYEHPLPQEPQLPFDHLMNEAQDLHGSGQFAPAQGLWQQAVSVAPNTIEKARAIRGDAASSYQLGDATYAAGRAAEAYEIHNQVVQAATQYNHPYRIEALRERAQSASVLGRIATATTVAKELSGEVTATVARQEAQQGLTLLDSALQDVETVEQETRAPDQYRINAISHLAIGHSLYGDAYSAAHAAGEARKIAWKSESEPGISFGRRARAVLRATVRAYSASVVHSLATSEPSRRRTLALKIAANKRFGL